jgi:CheY-like chemotaxis protein
LPKHAPSTRALIDLQLPDQAASVLAEAIRQQPAGRELPLLLLSSPASAQR